MARRSSSSTVISLREAGSGARPVRTCSGARPLPHPPGRRKPRAARVAARPSGRCARALWKKTGRSEQAWPRASGTVALHPAAHLLGRQAVPYLKTWCLSCAGVASFDRRRWRHLSGTRGLPEHRCRYAQSNCTGRRGSRGLTGRTTVPAALALRRLQAGGAAIIRQRALRGWLRSRGRPTLLLLSRLWLPPCPGLASTPVGEPHQERRGHGRRVHALPVDTRITWQVELQTLGAGSTPLPRNRSRTRTLGIGAAPDGSSAALTASLCTAPAAVVRAGCLPRPGLAEQCPFFDAEGALPRASSFRCCTGTRLTTHTERQGEACSATRQVTEANDELRGRGMPYGR